MTARFYLDKNIGEIFSNQNIIMVSGDLYRYMVTVRRFGIGDQIIVFNGDGIDYRGQIVTKTNKNINIELMGKSKVELELAQNINLFMAVISNQKMSLVIQKAVELGVKQITPVVFDYSQKSPQELIQHRLDHWQSVAQSALEQCGRNCYLKINYPIKLLEIPSKNTVIADFDGVKINTWIKSQPTQNLLNINLVIGPEGGFSLAEKAIIKEKYNLVSLSNNILRAETAAIFLIAKIII